MRVPGLVVDHLGFLFWVFSHVFSFCRLLLVGRGSWGRSPHGTTKILSRLSPFSIAAESPPHAGLQSPSRTNVRGWMDVWALQCLRTYILSFFRLIPLPSLTYASSSSVHLILNPNYPSHRTNEHSIVEPAKKLNFSCAEPRYHPFNSLVPIRL